jgi:mannose-6-phosphate isomerase-like protein (cupin superfamily)
LFDGVTLMWTPHPTFPVAKIAPPDFVSPVVPPGSNGIEFLLGRGSFLGIIPWVSLRDLDPGGGWQRGIDTKVLDDDDDLGVTVQVIRLRPGRRTPLIRIPASTHLWILSGRAFITPAGEAPREMQQDIYAFVPNGFAFQLSNPAELLIH